jgi:hypothetical protein
MADRWDIHSYHYVTHRYLRVRSARRRSAWWLLGGVDLGRHPGESAAAPGVNPPAGHRSTASLPMSSQYLHDRLQTR